MKLILSRFCIAPDNKGTFGLLWFEHAPKDTWWTLERPWKNNEPSVSCIPTGTYKLRHGTFNAGGGYPDLEFVNVPGRQNIEIHRANVVSELKGCIAPGKTLNITDWSVRKSKVALNEILEEIAGATDIDIVISWAFPGEVSSGTQAQRPTGSTPGL